MFQEYIERGLSVVPVLFKDKKPFLAGWGRYHRELASEEDIALWESKYIPGQNINIGVCLGRVSGIVALDIDTDDKRVLDTCPLSPVVRKGARGEVRFFKWREGLYTKELLGSTVELMSEGKQVVLPPSIHPSGVPYKWVTLDTLENISTSDLPDLDMSFLNDLAPLRGEFNANSVAFADGGRNNRLKDIVAAMATRDMIVEEIVEEIYQVDKQENSPRLFTDASEGFKAKSEEDAYKNARKFALSVYSSLNSKGLISSRIVPKETIAAAVVDLRAIKSMARAKKHKKLPRLPGIAQELFEDIYNNSWIPRTPFSYMASLQILSQAIGLRVCYRGVYANLYQYGIAPTGAGKESPLRKVMAYVDGLHKDILATDPTSSSIMRVYFKDHMERLVVINEADKHLKTISHPKTNQGLREMLTDTFDIGKKIIGRKVLTGSGTKTDSYDSLEKAFLSMMLFSTPQGFFAADFDDLQSTGYFARYFFYIDDRPKDAEYKESVDEGARPDLLNRLKAIHSKNQTDYLVGNDVFTYNLGATDEATAYEKVLIVKLNQIRRKHWDSEQRFLGIVNRFFFNVKKLALIHHVSTHEANYERPLELTSLQWAEEAVTAIMTNMLLELEKMPGGSAFEHDCSKIVSYALKKGEPLTKRQITLGVRLHFKGHIGKYLGYLVNDSEQLIYDASAKSYIYNPKNDQNV
jgi:hypothetical protein